MLNRAMRSLLKPLIKCAGAEFEVRLKEENVWRCCLRVGLHCCDISETKDMSSIRHRAGRFHLCVRCMISFENMLHRRRRQNRVMEVTSGTLRQVLSLKERAGLKEERDRRQSAVKN